MDNPGIFIACFYVAIHAFLIFLFSLPCPTGSQFEKEKGMLL